MKKRTVLVLIALAALAGQTIGLGSASALTTTYTGTFDGTEPTMPVVAITTPNCTTQGTTPVGYEVINFPNPVPGAHTFELSSTGPTANFASMYLYESSFDPTDGLTNCVAATNDGTPKTINFDLVAGTPYFLVVFDDTFQQVGGDYSLVVTSPDPPPTTTTTSTTTAPTTTVAPTTAPPVTVAPAVVARPAVATPAFTG